MKTPDEVRRDLNAAREAFKLRYEMYRAWGVTGMPSSMQDWHLSKAADDDAEWGALVDMYIRDYEDMLKRDAEFQAMTRQWRREHPG